MPTVAPGRDLQATLATSPAREAEASAFRGPLGKVRGSQRPARALGPVDRVCFAHVAPRRDVRAPAGWFPQRTEASDHGGLVREIENAVRHGYARANLPRSVLRNRDWSFLILISRVSAACSVACGVLPAGLVQ